MFILRVFVQLYESFFLPIHQSIMPFQGRNHPSRTNMVYYSLCRHISQQARYQPGIMSPVHKITMDISNAAVPLVDVTSKKDSITKFDYLLSENNDGKGNKKMTTAGLFYQHKPSSIPRARMRPTLYYMSHDIHVSYCKRKQPNTQPTGFLPPILVFQLTYTGQEVETLHTCT